MSWGAAVLVAAPWLQSSPVYPAWEIESPRKEVIESRVVLIYQAEPAPVTQPVIMQGRFATCGPNGCR